jgi:hypothetical protein
VPALDQTERVADLTCEHWQGTAMLRGGRPPRRQRRHAGEARILGVTVTVTVTVTAGAGGVLEAVTGRAHRAACVLVP